MPLTIRTAEQDDDAKAILEFLRQMHAEVGRAPLNDTKALMTIFETAANGAAFMVEDGGEIVASMGLNEIDFWYSDATFLGETWLYVLPAYRDDGVAVGLLFEEARALGTMLGLSVLIDHHRPRYTSTSGLSILADRYEFKPVGRVIAIEPAGEPADVL